MSSVVIKVGGSLLDWPELPTALTGFLHGQRPGSPVLVVGGGEMVDVLRRLDALHAIGEEASHRLALGVLDLTADLLVQIVSNTTVVDHPDGLDHVWRSGRTPVLRPARFLDEVPCQGGFTLPRTWSTTSDSIAAWLARYLGCGLALLKSTAPRHALSRSEAAALGLVDPVFPEASRSVERVEMVNLRAQPVVAVELT